MQFTAFGRFFCLAKTYFFTLPCNKSLVTSLYRMMKKPQTYYAIGIFAITVVLIAGLLALPKSWSVSQLNTVNSKAVTEKTEKISAGMPLWHAIPRFLFRRY
jgi:hypothetical protein